MNNGNRKDDDLIKILRKFPKIEDKRSMEEVYMNIKKEKANDQNRILQNKKRLLLPSFATVAVLILSFFLFTNQFNRQMQNDNDAREVEIALDHSIEQNNGQEKLELFSSDAEDTAELKRHTYQINIEGKNAIYPDDLKEDDFVVTIGIPDNEIENIVPISVIVKKDLGNHWVDFYNFVYENIDEEGLGLLDYYPYRGVLKNVNDQITLDLRTDHQYDQGSASEYIFFNSLDFFKYQNIDKIYLNEASSPGVDFSHTGTIHEYMIDDSRSGYLTFKINSQVFFIPSPNKFDSIEDALTDMQQDNDNYQLQPTIPSHIEYTIDNSDPGELKFIFENTVDLKDDSESVRMIEAILLTAKEYGYETVLFENANIKKLGPFSLESPIQVPLAPNPVQIEINE